MRILLFIIFIVNSVLVNAQEAEFSFEKTSLKFPKTPEGEVLKFEYKFTNSGKSPLIITEIKVACPCTTFEYPKTPVAPGAEASIRVTFDTKGKIGYQDRILEVYANTSDSPVKLRFKVMVDNKHKAD